LPIKLALLTCVRGQLSLILVLSLLVAGCGVRELARGELEPPRITFQGLKLYRPTAAGWPLAATLLLRNPNPQTLRLLGYDYELWLEGRKVVQGASQEAVTLPPLGETVAEVPILVKLPALMSLLPAFLRQNQRLTYQVTGGFRLASVLGGLIRVPFRFQGQITPREGVEQLQPFLEKVRP
jgi:LEA14-like dessication related protein